MEKQLKKIWKKGGKKEKLPGKYKAIIVDKESSIRGLRLPLNKEYGGKIKSH
jgi:hypothetical protein